MYLFVFISVAIVRPNTLTFEFLLKNAFFCICNLVYWVSKVRLESVQPKLAYSLPSLSFTDKMPRVWTDGCRQVGHHSSISYRLVSKHLLSCLVPSSLDFSKVRVSFKSHSSFCRIITIYKSVEWFLFPAHRNRIRADDVCMFVYVCCEGI